MFKNIDIKTGFQKFGAAMFVPVLLFSFSGLIVGFTTIFKDQSLVGKIADPNGFFYKLMFIMEEGGWTIFRNMPLFFCLGIPIGLSKMAPERAVLATLICYLSYNYFIAAILNFWGPVFGVDFTQLAGGVSGLALIAGIKTLDTNILGAIVVGLIITMIHNRFYETKLPDYLGVFQGTSFVHIIGFLVMLVFAFLTCLIWPKIQLAISSMQTFLASSGGVGVFIYTFLESINTYRTSPFYIRTFHLRTSSSSKWYRTLLDTACCRVCKLNRAFKNSFPSRSFCITWKLKGIRSTWFSFGYLFLC